MWPLIFAVHSRPLFSHAPANSSGPVTGAGNFSLKLSLNSSSNVLIFAWCLAWYRWLQNYVAWLIRYDFGELKNSMSSSSSSEQAAHVPKKRARCVYHLLLDTLSKYEAAALSTTPSHQDTLRPDTALDMGTTETGQVWKWNKQEAYIVSQMARIEIEYTSPLLFFAADWGHTVSVTWQSPDIIVCRVLWPSPSRCPHK